MFLVANHNIIKSLIILSNLALSFMFAKKKNNVYILKVALNFRNFVKQLLQINMILKAFKIFVYLHIISALISPFCGTHKRISFYCFKHFSCVIVWVSCSAYLYLCISGSSDCRNSYEELFCFFWSAAKLNI